MNLSRFGQLLAQDSPIVQLMEDLGEALSRNPQMLFLGGGNPARVPEAQACFQQHLSQLVGDPAASARLRGVYAAPRGDDTTLRILADYLAKECGWPVDVGNIALVSGSQLAYFIVLNCFATKLRPARTPPSTFLFLPIHFSNSPGIWRSPLPASRQETQTRHRSSCARILSDAFSLFQ